MQLVNPELYKKGIQFNTFNKWSSKKYANKIK